MKFATFFFVLNELGKIYIYQEIIKIIIGRNKFVGFYIGEIQVSLSSQWGVMKQTETLMKNSKQKGKK